MQMRSVLRFGLAVVGCASACYAADVWNRKDSAQWTDEEVTQVLTRSPWAKQIQVAIDPSGVGGTLGGRGAGRGGGRGGGGGRSGGMGGGGMSGGGMEDGGIEGGRGMGGGGMGGGGMGGGGMGGQGEGYMPTMNVLVRWQSAKPVQQALARLGNRAAPPEETAEKHYVISVAGLRMAGRRQPGNGFQAGAQKRGGNPGQIREQLMAYTRLIRKGKDPIAPDDIRMVQRGGSGDLLFYFPPTPPISPYDKEVTFATRIGSTKVQYKFKLKEMTCNGKLELN